MFVSSEELSGNNNSVMAEALKTNTRVRESLETLSLGKELDKFK